MLRFTFVVVLMFASPAYAQYRPLSMGDIVDAVGSNPEGMPVDELGERISTYAYFTSDDQGVGLAVRFASDPEGAVFVGWRFRGELWRYEWIEEPGLGRLESIKPAGRGFVLDTRHPDGTGSAAVLRSDLTVVATVPGIPRLSLPTGAVVLQQANAVVLFEPASSRVVPVFTAASPALTSFTHETSTGTITFEVRSGGVATVVRCAAVSTPQRKCQ